MSSTMETSKRADAERLVLGRDPQGTRQSERRRSYLNQACLPRPLVALEIGAFDNPTLRASDGFAVRYADHFSTDELRDAHRNNPRRRLDQVVDIDYVTRGLSLSSLVNETVDLIVANHVIEHLPDPIAWLRDVARFCAPHATIFLTVPDRRFTFDIHKQPSDVTSLVRAYEERKSQPDVYDLARMRHLHTRVDAKALWEGASAPSITSFESVDYRTILERARDEVVEGYVDAHCHFYTSKSFIEIFSELARSGYTGWRPRLLTDVVHGDNEFTVVLMHA